VRGSTNIAEKIDAQEYSLLLNKFYQVVTNILVRTDAYVDKFVGDEVMAVYLPLFAGKDPALKAVIAARELLAALDRGGADGPRLPVGVGVHTGPAFFGTVAGAEGLLSDFTALGDTVNVAARIVGSASAGEALISEDTAIAARLETSGFEHRLLQVKGKSEPVGVYAVRR